MGCLMALGGQVLQQSLCTCDAASQPFCVAPLGGSPLRKAIHADVYNKVTELGILVLQCPGLQGVQRRLTARQETAYAHTDLSVCMHTRLVRQGGAD